MVDVPRLSDDDNLADVKLFTELCAEDFRRHPVWVVCACVDPGQPWYDEEADHGAIRPWYDLPIDPMLATFYVTCTVTLADDSSWEGYLIVSPGFHRIWYEPRIYLPSGTAVGFWGGVSGVAECVRSELYRELGRSSDDVFPIEFRVPTGALEYVPGATIHGFSRLLSIKTMRVICEV